MKRKMLLFCLLLFCASFVLADSNDGDQIVSVPKKYVSTEGMNHQAPALVPEVSKYVGFGREIGIATREGLTAAVDMAEKFGNTKVGNFVLVMVAWKIMAKDVLGVVLGIPIFFVGLAVWFWLAKRLFFGYRVMEKKEGTVKTYADHPAYEFYSRDASGCAGTFMGLALAVWMIVMICVIF